MKFKKLFIIKNDDDTYTVSLTKKEKYDVYFTTDEGFGKINPHLDEKITFAQLPTPLLKQIK